jgi:hypothetical protein
MAATAAMAMTNRAPHPLRGLRPRTSEGFRISLDLNPSGPMDLGPPADRLFLHCPPILTSQRGLSLWTKIPATQIYSPPSNKIPEWYSFVLSFSSKEKIFFEKVEFKFKFEFKLNGFVFWLNFFVAVFLLPFKQPRKNIFREKRWFVEINWKSNKFAPKTERSRVLLQDSEGWSFDKNTKQQY